MAISDKKIVERNASQDDMDPPRVNAYSLESFIAEKLEAIIHNGYLNKQ